jgi:hypothetical protein
MLLRDVTALLNNCTQNYFLIKKIKDRFTRIPRIFSVLTNIQSLKFKQKRRKKQNLSPF